MRHLKQIIILVAVGILLVGIGFRLGRSGAPAGTDDPHESHADKNSGKAIIWTCSMHPQVRQAEPGKCQFCGMDLIPATDSGDENTGARSLSMSEEAMRMSDLQTVVVARRFVDIEIPLVGKIDYDETRLKTIAAWVPGRLDRLFVDYTGIPVKAGDHLAEIYSPELFSTQEELLQSLQAVKSLAGSASEMVRHSTEKTVIASREKLHLLGLSLEQIAEVERRGTASATVQINAPVGGIVIHKNANEGSYVKTGQPLYTLADLSLVWVMLDAYESDIARLRYGQEVEIKTEAYGDRIFPGWISFIDPVLNPQTRTIRVRVVVKNPDGSLRPNMFARAVVRARVAEDDQVVSRNLQGKWISPMHPEVIKDAPGACDVCGMPLVRAEELGYAAAGETKPPLVVPASAVLTTGRRAIVYVKVPGKERPTYEGVEVRVGARAGDFYVISSGLQEGQEVVTQGNFKIDSALQLQAKPSMMSPEEDKPAAPDMKMAEPEAAKPRENPQAFLQQLAPLYEAYLKTQQALASDQETEARAALDRLADALGKVDMTLVKEQAHRQWMDLSRQFAGALEHRKHLPGIEGARKIFLNVSKPVIVLEKTFGHVGAVPHHIAFCPMADGGKGAEWLQLEDKVKNPYYGSAMLTCGEIRETLAPQEAPHGQSR